MAHRGQCAKLHQATCSSVTGMPLNGKKQIYQLLKIIGLKIPNSLSQVEEDQSTIYKLQLN